MTFLQLFEYTLLCAIFVFVLILRTDRPDMLSGYFRHTDISSTLLSADHITSLQMVGLIDK